ncbi:MAG TPA: Hsp20/alpha crystallin family protein [Devosia sp.]
MNMRDLIPWGRNNNQAPVDYRGQEANPFLELHREMNRLFDETFRSLDGSLSSFGSPTPWTANWPGVDISENDREIRVSAELPGVEEKDVDVVLEDDVLVIKGEKRSEIDDKERQFSERYYGSFERRLPLGAEVEEDKVTAKFKNGVLTIVLPKSPAAQQKTKRIAINGQLH